LEYKFITTLLIIMPKENNSKNQPAESVKTEVSEREIDETLDESFPASDPPS